MVVIDLEGARSLGAVECDLGFCSIGNNADIEHGLFDEPSTIVIDLECSQACSIGFVRTANEEFIADSSKTIAGHFTKRSTRVMQSPAF